LKPTRVIGGMEEDVSLMRGLAMQEVNKEVNGGSSEGKTGHHFI